MSEKGKNFCWVDDATVSVLRTLAQLTGLRTSAILRNLLYDAYRKTLTLPAANDNVRSNFLRLYPGGELLLERHPEHGQEPIPED